MTDEQWSLLKDIIDGNLPATRPVGFIIDSPWLPNWYGISILDYFSNDNLWLKANLKVMQDFPSAMFLPGFWSEFGMCTEPSAFGSKSTFPPNEFPHAHPVIRSADDIAGLSQPNPAVDGLVKDTREQIGLELFPKFEVASSLLTYLAANGCVAILADQRARKMNVTVDFLGQPASTTAAPAVLAVKSRAALIPAFIYYRGKGSYRICFDEEIVPPPDRPIRETVREVTGRIAAVFAARIRSNPELWLWAHRRWRK